VTCADGEAEAKRNRDGCKASGTPGDFSTGARKGLRSARAVLGGDVDLLVVRGLVQDLDLVDERRNGLRFFNRAAVDELPSFRRHLGPVGLAQLAGRLTGRVEEHGVTRFCFRRDVLVDQRVAVLVHHLLPDGQVDGRVLLGNPGCVVDVFGFSEDAFVGLGEVDGLVFRGLLRHLLLFVDLDPLGVDRRVVVGEQAGFRLHRGLPQVALGVLGEVEGLVRCRFLSYLSLRVAEPLPFGERLLFEPPGVCRVERSGAVFLQELRETGDCLFHDDLLGFAELDPAGERRLFEQSSVGFVERSRAVCSAVLLVVGGCLNGNHHLGSSVLVPARER